MSIYTSLGKLATNIITNSTVGVPVFLNAVSKILWGAVNAGIPITLGNSDIYNDPTSRKDVVFNPSDGKWYEKNGIFPNDQIFDTPLPQDIQDDLNNAKNRFEEFLANNQFIPGDFNNNGIPDISEGNWQKIDPKAEKIWDDAVNWILRRDPLTFDLDGDGLETTGVAATNPILFDHDGDGIKNGTGWVNADDGFLVRDVNGNGTIDSGRELFGDSTIKSNGQLATDGFNALADLDSMTNGGNADGKISNLDAQFANLLIWRDLNQDGISQTGELFTLASLNIASINVTSTANSQTLPNGNQIADLGTFTKTDGTTGSTGAVTGNLAGVNLAGDTFHRTFPDVLDTSSVASLPDMQGSGKVRDLSEAANDAEWRIMA